LRHWRSNGIAFLLRGTGLAASTSAAAAVPPVATLGVVGAGIYVRVRAQLMRPGLASHSRPQATGIARHEFELPDSILADGEALLALRGAIASAKQRLALICPGGTGWSMLFPEAENCASVVLAEVELEHAERPLSLPEVACGIELDGQVHGAMRPWQPILQELVCVDQHGPLSGRSTRPKSRWAHINNDSVAAGSSAHVLRFYPCLPVAGLSPSMIRSLRRFKVLLRFSDRGQPLPAWGLRRIVGLPLRRAICLQALSR